MSDKVKEVVTYANDSTVQDPDIYLSLRPAHEDDKEPAVLLKVLPCVTWQVVKARLRTIKDSMGPYRYEKDQTTGSKVEQRLKRIPDANIRLLHKGVELQSGSMVDDYNLAGGTIDQPAELTYLIIDRSGTSVSNIGLYADSNVPCRPEMNNLIREALDSMSMGVAPHLTEEGTGATYIIKDTSRRNLAVFKPKDEEAFAPQNPRGYVGPENTRGLREGVLSTHQAAREVAAYLLDHSHFARVPETTLVHAKHPKFAKCKTKNGDKIVWKIGAFQKFVETKDTSGNFAPQVFSVHSVHKIGILDIRLVNLDRNDGNLLVRPLKAADNTVVYQLTPIDHGLSLPDCLEVYTDDIAWMAWPQAKKPFGPKELEYIHNLSGSKDARILSDKLGIRRECLRLMEVTTKLLQIGAAAGLSLYEIGKIMYRDDRCSDDAVQPSKLEQLIKHSLDLALTVSYQGQAAAAVSQTLASLDLSSSKHVRDSKITKHHTGAGSQTSPPVAPMKSPMASPMFNPLKAAMALPQWSLDGTDDVVDDGPAFDMVIDTPQAGQLGGRANGVTVDAEDGEAFAGAPRQRTSLQHGHSFRGTRLRQHRGSAAVPRASGDENASQANGETSIFSRPGLPGSAWPIPLERAFKEFITSQIEQYIAKHFGDRARRAAQTDGEAKDAESPPDADGSSSSDSSSSDEDNSLRAAFGGIMPSEVDDQPKAPAKARYVPPQLRKILEEEEAQRGADEAPKEPPLAATRGKYIPPQQRRAMMEAAPLPPVQEDSKGDEQPKLEEPKTDEPPPLPKPKYIPPAMRKAMAAEAAAAAAAAPASPPASGPQTTSVVPRLPACPSELIGGNARIGFCFNQGPRPYMEDGLDAIQNFANEPNLEFFAVYDGHSGSQAVEFLKERIPVLLQEQKPDYSDESSVARAFAETFTAADEELMRHILDHKDAMPKKTTGEYALSPGSVATVTLVRDGILHIANLGDCRALLCNGGTVIQLTEDHCAKDNQVERERLEAIGVEVSSDGYLHGRICVSRAFGDWAWEAGEKCKGLIANPDTSCVKLQEDSEFLLLACDGIFEKMSSKEVGLTVRRRLRSTGDPKAAAESLVKMALASKGSDNLSAIVVMFKQPPTEGDAGRTAPRLFGARRAVLTMPAEEEPRVPAESSDNGISAPQPKADEREEGHVSAPRDA